MLWIWLVDLAVGLVVERFNGFEIQRKTTLGTLEADFMP
jgi:hypothetical protein